MQENMLALGPFVNNDFIAENEIQIGGAYGELARNFCLVYEQCALPSGCSCLFYKSHVAYLWVWAHVCILICMCETFILLDLLGCNSYFVIGFGGCLQRRTGPAGPPVWDYSMCLLVLFSPPFQSILPTIRHELHILVFLWSNCFSPSFLPFADCRFFF